MSEGVWVQPLLEDPMAAYYSTHTPHAHISSCLEESIIITHYHPLVCYLTCNFIKFPKKTNTHTHVAKLFSGKSFPLFIQELGVFVSSSKGPSASDFEKVFPKKKGIGKECKFTY